MANKYPYTTFNEYNLDWIINKIHEFEHSLTDFEITHTITYGGEWDISKAYTQWTIVSDPITHDGFLSIKPVPVNIQLDNEDYWLKIADYSTGIAEVNARIDDVEDDINDIEDDITDNVKPSITAIESDITDNIKPDIVALDARLDALENRRIVMFGDSYANGWTVDGTFTPWTSRFKTYYESITGKTITTHVFYYDGIGFINSNDGETFNTLLTTASNTLTDPETVTDVIVGGGYNDNNYSTGDIQTAVGAWVSRAKTIFPNAVIWIAPIGYTRDGAARERINERVIPAYSNNTESVVMPSTIRVLHYYPSMASDFMHPNQSGQNAIAYAMVSDLLGMTYTPFNLYERTGKFATVAYTKNTSGYASININAMTEFWIGNMIGLWSDLSSFAFATAQTLGGSEMPYLLTLNDSPLIGEMNHDVDGWDAFGIAQTSNYNYNLCRMRFYIVKSGSDLQLRFKAWAINGNSTNYLSNVTNIFNITFANNYIAETLC